jgi:FkbM family methyltransferase
MGNQKPVSEMNKAEKVIDLLKFWIRNPYTISIAINRILRMPELKKKGLKTLAPNYVFFEKFNENSVIIDVGCGYEAELSKYLMDQYHIKKAYAVDPTEKHAKALQEIQNRHGNRFVHLKYALAEKETELEFFETLEKESGSLLSDHKNVLHDRIQKYKVKAITLYKLLEIISSDRVAFIKIDIEGMEFALFNEINPEILKRFDQIFVEFHHYSVRSFHVRDTRKIVKKLEGFGLKSFTIDTINYLFYW